MKNKLKILLILIVLVLIFTNAFPDVIKRFPKPDFKTGYSQPIMNTPEPRTLFWEYFDVFVLLITLSMASYLSLKKRSRNYIFLLLAFSLAYFGFFREGCVCSIGAIQNVALSLADSSYVIPLTVIAFFALPLLFTLFFGRGFCAAVCPLGAIQDVMVIKPLNVPKWLDEVLGFLPYLYLGFGVLFAATGAGFIICQYDPFVGFFRFGATFNMILLGVSLLLLGTVIGRPYCRYLCPYGVLLNWMSRLSRRNVNITPSECTNCRLCEESCPFGAIDKPVLDPVPPKKESDTKIVALLIILIPVMIIAGGWVISSMHKTLARQHFTVSLAEEIILEDSGKRSETTEITRTFRASGQPTKELFNEANLIQNRFLIGSWILGGFLGLILALKLVNLSIRKKYPEYVANKGSCLSCGRCFAYCPFEQERREKEIQIITFDGF
jgi:NosR/NirI family nitrous oxide reductase transcriptional regulator